ncbi:MAG: sterol desaturase family protein [Hydrogenophaga sp.]|uniref:sterol desaturase family protein n=1 Tax=Hydrogenophaga sp. TaxID=1904254 RepID=UPI0016B0A8F1|nr:sterol desaturase family protein [Hydrogenophaga sp.]NIM71195.1 sterol desaturase family protein [Xanthomonadales bacterium]NIM40427.1 sterol desaturase family protein [Hydrogenophaga sp.]NIO13204.1 sterol desaturase family protein [Xanthomonadales bacterium]NIO50834.1 sterol desaturase family protein [Hydrogenophaga sp.]NIO89056.1 sterol desaturase family protein [Hydrogenophaga sp.]
MSTRSLLLLRAVGGVAVLALLFALEGLIPFFPDRKARLRHVALNLAIGGINLAAVALLLVWPIRWAAQWAQQSGFGLARWAGLSGAGAVAFGVVAFDAWMYGWHQANHRLGFLWRFHRMHHSERDMDVSTAVRFHPGEIAISSFLRAGVLVGLGMSYQMLVIYELVLLPIIQLHHSNVRLPRRLDRALRAVIVSPNMHRLHHSVIRREHDGNYASIFSFWDRLLGSYRWRADPQRLELGLKRLKDRSWLTLRGMLATPLR